MSACRIIMLVRMFLTECEFVGVVVSEKAASVSSVWCNSLVISV